ncbi:serine/threonine-protein kinase/endoribonuclease IRE1a-like [Rhodamnia argentea]|uniref:Serine/threonine-protein kinase/endoribonuclease IRE1a-like n=1 Tax=Rhodamnia argentea TaxID=178133 RepID=A0ABM3HU26_9MYRT|nr:serine/threonine-protein kinase/endoribonuclease IRE1a-like [Rhodamnia argentea]
MGTVAIDGGSRAGEILVSRTVIGKGSNGTIVFEGTYDGQPVAVKRLVRGHRAVDFDEIYYLMTSYSHPNIVRYCGAKYDLDFVDLALERCRCSLHDLIVAFSASLDFSVCPHDPPSMAKYKNKLESIRVEMQDVNLWIDGGRPSVLLLKLMRLRNLGMESTRIAS